MRVWSEDLKCYWKSWEAKGPSVLWLRIPKQSCCDMRGAVKVAQELTSNVLVVEVFSGDRHDCSYVRRADGSWEFIGARERQ